MKTKTTNAIFSVPECLGLVRPLDITLIDLYWNFIIRLSFKRSNFRVEGE